MRIFLAAVSVAALSLTAACTQAGQDNAQADANEAASKTSTAAQEAGASLKEEAQQVGSAVAAGARDAAQAVDRRTDELARDAERRRAEDEAAKAATPVTPVDGKTN